MRLGRGLSADRSHTKPKPKPRPYPTPGFSPTSALPHSVHQALQACMELSRRLGTDVDTGDGARDGDDEGVTPFGRLLAYKVATEAIELFGGLTLAGRSAGAAIDAGSAATSSSSVLVRAAFAPSKIEGLAASHMSWLRAMRDLHQLVCDIAEGQEDTGNPYAGARADLIFHTRAVIEVDAVMAEQPSSSGMQCDAAARAERLYSLGYELCMAAYEVVDETDQRRLKQEGCRVLESACEAATAADDQSRFFLCGRWHSR